MNNPTIRVRGRADSLLSPDRGTAAYDRQVQRANTAEDVALGAGRLFAAHIGAGTSTDYVDGTPVRPTRQSVGRQSVARQSSGQDIPTVEDDGDQSFSGATETVSGDPTTSVQQSVSNYSGGYDPGNPLVPGNIAPTTYGYTGLDAGQAGPIATRDWRVCPGYEQHRIMVGCPEAVRLPRYRGRRRTS